MLAAEAAVQARRVRNQIAQAPAVLVVLELQTVLLGLLLHTLAVAEVALTVVVLMVEQAVLAVVVLAAEL